MTDIPEDFLRFCIPLRFQVRLRQLQNEIDPDKARREFNVVFANARDGEWCEATIVMGTRLVGRENLLKVHLTRMLYDLEQLEPIAQDIEYSARQSSPVDSKI